MKKKDLDFLATLAMALRVRKG